MNRRFSGWLIVFTGVLLQFIFEITLGRVAVAPAILVPLLVYLSISRGDYWSIEGAFWSGFMLDLLLHHTPGVSSLAMILGISFSGWLLRVTTGAAQMTFVASALIASVFSDIIFILLASYPTGSGFSVSTLLVIPRVALPLMLYLAIPLLVTGRTARTGAR